MKKLAFRLIAVALLAALLPAAASAHTADKPLTAKLMAGQSIYAGHVEVWNDADDLHVRFQAKYGELGYCLEETHLHVAESLADIPQNKKAPIPGHFQYGEEDLGCAHDWEEVIPLGDWVPGTPLFIAAHAVVGNRFDLEMEETGWGVLCGHLDEYEIIPGSPRWAAYIPYTVQGVE